MRKILYLIIALLVPFLMPISVNAEGMTGSEIINLNINPDYVNTYGASCGSAGSVALVGSDNQQKAYNYFVAQGLTSAQSAGLVGNFISESNMNPTIQNGIGAYGIAQWLDGRKSALQLLPNYDTLEVQLAFVMTELSGSEGVANSALRAVTGNDVEDAAQAASVVAYKYERPESVNGAPALLNERMANARGIFKLYGSGSGGASNSTAAISSASCGGGVATGDFVHYAQCDPAWGGNSYGDSTVCGAGCGPTSMAMIISTLTGQKVTPAETSAWAGSKGLKVEGGSSWSIAPLAAEHWGLTSKPTGADPVAITDAIKGGALVIVAGQGPSPFTTGGHYIVIRGVTADGKWLVGNSAESTLDTKEWDPAAITPYMNGGSAYAISK